MERVAVYIDGFNLYYGVRQTFGRRFLWLDLEAMSRSLLQPNQTLVAVKYFTARVRRPADSQLCQNTYLDALGSTSVQVIEGKLQLNDVKCPQCQTKFKKPEEKRTDVAIASHMVADAYLGDFDAAMIVGGDSDMIPPVTMVTAMSNRRVIVACPPARQSHELMNIAGSRTFINRANLAQSQLPDPCALPSGVIVNRPAEWV